MPHNVVPFQREAFSFDDEDTEDNRSFFRRYRVALLMVAIFALVAIYSIRLVAHSGPGPRKESTLVMACLATTASSAAGANRAARKGGRATSIST